MATVCAKGTAEKMEDNPQRAIPARNSGQLLPAPLPVSQWCADLPRLSTTSATAIPHTSSITQPASISSMTSGDDGDIVDPRPNPRFISHMPAVFNKQYATEQHLHEQKRAEDEEKLKNKKRAKETVVGYTWYQVWSIDFCYLSC